MDCPICQHEMIPINSYETGPIYLCMDCGEVVSTQSMEVIKRERRNYYREVLETVRRQFRRR